MPTLPLHDVTVLDLADEATVLASRFLAELGADVVRVERATGDTVRRRPPFLHDQEGLERSLAHLLYNGGKRSLAVDFDDPATPGPCWSAACPPSTSSSPPSTSLLPWLPSSTPSLRPTPTSA